MDKENTPRLIFVPPKRVGLSYEREVSFRVDGELMDLPWRYVMDDKLASRQGGMSANARRLAIGIANSMERFRERWSDILNFAEKGDMIEFHPFTVLGMVFTPSADWLSRAKRLPQLGADNWRGWAQLHGRVSVQLAQADVQK
jgi:hypothetical protein